MDHSDHQNAGAGYDSDEDGGLFGSNSEEVDERQKAFLDAGSAPSKIKDEERRTQADGLGMGIFALEATCNSPATSSTIRLGPLLASAAVVASSPQFHEESESFKKSTLAAPDLPSTDKCCLELRLNSRQLDAAGLSPEDVRHSLLALDIGLCVHADSAESAHLVVNIHATPTGEVSQSTVFRLLAHLVDLPIERIKSERGEPQPKRAKVAEAESSTSCGLQLMQAVEELATRTEGLLDELCDEKAALPFKSSSEQQAFRETAVAELTQSRAAAASKVKCLLERPATARQQSSRDRWLESSDAPAAPADTDALVWAKKVSDLWQDLSEERREELRSITDEDHIALKVSQHDQPARRLQDLIEEADVFLRSLEFTPLQLSFIREVHQETDL